MSRRTIGGGGLGVIPSVVAAAATEATEATEAAAGPALFHVHADSSSAAAGAEPALRQPSRSTSPSASLATSVALLVYDSYQSLADAANEYLWGGDLNPENLQIINVVAQNLISAIANQKRWRDPLDRCGPGQLFAPTQETIENNDREIKRLAWEFNNSLNARHRISGLSDPSQVTEVHIVNLKAIALELARCSNANGWARLIFTDTNELRYLRNPEQSFESRMADDIHECIGHDCAFLVDVFFKCLNSWSISWERIENEKNMRIFFGANQNAKSCIALHGDDPRLSEGWALEDAIKIMLVHCSNLHETLLRHHFENSHKIFTVAPRTIYSYGNGFQQINEEEILVNGSFTCLDGNFDLQDLEFDQEGFLVKPSGYDGPLAHVRFQLVFSVNALRGVGCMLARNSSQSGGYDSERVLNNVVAQIIQVGGIVVPGQDVPYNLAVKPRNYIFSSSKHIYSRIWPGTSPVSTPRTGSPLFGLSGGTSRAASPRRATSRATSAATSRATSAATSRAASPNNVSGGAEDISTATAVSRPLERRGTQVFSPENRSFGPPPICPEHNVLQSGSNPLRPPSERIEYSPMGSDDDN